MFQIDEAILHTTLHPNSQSNEGFARDRQNPIDECDDATGKLFEEMSSFWLQQF